MTKSIPLASDGPDAEVGNRRLFRRALVAISACLFLFGLNACKTKLSENDLEERCKNIKGCLTEERFQRNYRSVRTCVDLRKSNYEMLDGDNIRHGLNKDLGFRDPKGLYERVRAGEIDNFTGIDAPYEEPLDSSRSPKNSATAPQWFVAYHCTLRYSIF